MMDIGAFKSMDDPRDWIYERLVHAPDGSFFKDLPETFSLEDYNSGPRNQGQRGTCGAFVGAAIQEINFTRKNVQSEQLSPEFIYFHRANKPSAGMYGRDVCQVLRKLGTVPEEKYPYCERDGAAELPPREHYEVAAEYRIDNYARITTVDGLKRALIELGACYIGLPIYNTTLRFWDKNHGFDRNGGHAVVAIGYTAEGFIIKNSWGSNWGDNGTSIFPYDDFGCIWEAWATLKQ